MNPETPYSSKFYSTFANDSYNSARAVLGIVRNLINPKDVIDVGCGIGTWLKVWEEFGISSVTGVDGEYVDLDTLLIRRENFLPMDLSAPEQIVGRSFGLAQSMEVAEHLPESSAKRFVDFLCSLSPVVLFSAAIPHQGGTYHVNEQWPDYWADLFDQNDYAVFDVLRPSVWNRADVAFYYAQNALLFVGRSRLAAYPLLNGREAPKSSLSRVHPLQWEAEITKIPHFEDIVRASPRSFYDYAKRKFKGALKITTLRAKEKSSTSTHLAVPSSSAAHKNVLPTVSQKDELQHK